MRLGCLHVSTHGLCKAGADLAAENGTTEQRIAAIFGWSTKKEAPRNATEPARGMREAAAGLRSKRERMSLTFCSDPAWGDQFGH
jgi:hypothetical protein